MTKIVKVYLSPEVYKLLEKAAEKEKLSVAELIEKIINVGVITAYASQHQPAVAS